MTTVKLDFAIIGAQKAGTTALAEYLNQHPDIVLPDEKETHFFRRALTPDGPAERDPSILASKFSNVSRESVVGDATPVYLYWPYSLELLRDHNPDIKLIVSLRDPVWRAWSAWSMEVRRKRETLSFHEAITDGRARVSTAPFGVHKIYSYVERGFYAEQLVRALDIFPRSQFFFLRSEEIDTEGELLTSLTEFLEVATFQTQAHPSKLNSSSLPVSAEDGKDFAYLRDLYQLDIKRTAQLTGLDLDDWLI